MTVVLLLVELLARNAELRAVGYDDVVATVGTRVVDWFVLAHEQDCNARGETA